MKNRGIRFLIAMTLLAGTMPLAQAKPPKRNCGDRCELDYSNCLTRAGNRGAKKSCKVSHKMCKKTCA